jgi:hypothetical protein
MSPPDYTDHFDPGTVRNMIRIKGGRERLLSDLVRNIDGWRGFFLI